VGFEVIAIDDGSTDGSVDYIKLHYPQVHLLKNPGKGAPSARNAGLKAAQGKYILFLDSDDLIGADFFKARCAFLDEQPQINACYGDHDWFESDAAFSQDKIVFKHKYEVLTESGNDERHLQHYLGGWFLPLNSIIWRNDFLNKIGGLQEDLMINQDVDLVIRALFNKVNLAAFYDGSKVYIRNHSLDSRVGDPKNAEQKWLQMLQLRRSIFKELIARGYTDAVYLKRLSLYLFDHWKLLRHNAPQVAEQYLALSKEVYYPVEIKGGAAYRTLARVVGPVGAVKLKHLLLRHD
jgi:glycosyltransferase involved in cell wall biosynthesis